MAIPGAVAIRLLASGDARVALRTPQEKERILREAGSIEEKLAGKILREDYQVAVSGFPLSLRLEKGPKGNNKEAIQEILRDTQKRIPGLTISKIGWQRREDFDWEEAMTDVGQKARTRGTLILSIPTRHMQEALVQAGIVYKAELFQASLWDRRMVVMRCFRCAQWGHTQTTCGRPVACSHCAGPHDTRQCPIVIRIRRTARPARAGTTKHGKALSAARSKRRKLFSPSLDLS